MPASNIPKRRSLSKHPQPFWLAGWEYANARTLPGGENLSWHCHVSVPKMKRHLSSVVSSSCTQKLTLTPTPAPSPRAGETKDPKQQSPVSELTPRPSLNRNGRHLPPDEPTAEPQQPYPGSRIPSWPLANTASRRSLTYAPRHTPPPPFDPEKSLADDPSTDAVERRAAAGFRAGWDLYFTPELRRGRNGTRAGHQSRPFFRASESSPRCDWILGA